MILWTEEMTHLLFAACQKEDSCSNMVKYWRRIRKKVELKIAIHLSGAHSVCWKAKELIHCFSALLKLCWYFPCKINFKGWFQDTCLKSCLALLFPMPAEVDVNEDLCFVAWDFYCCASSRRWLPYPYWQKVKLKELQQHNPPDLPIPL